MKKQKKCPGAPGAGGHFAAALAVLVLGVLAAPALLLHLEAARAYITDSHFRAAASPFGATGFALFWRSLVLASCVMLGTLTAGMITGIVAAVGPRMVKTLLVLGGAVALALPPTLAAAPFVALTTASGRPQDGSLPAFFYSVLVLTACYYPLVTATVGWATSIIPREEWDSALLAGSPAKVWWHVAAPRIAPFALASALVCALMALWEMGAPDLLGWPTFSMNVYRNLAATNPGEAAGQSASVTAAVTGLPVMLLGPVFLLPAWRILGWTSLRPVSGGSNFQLPPLRGWGLLLIPLSLLWWGVSPGMTIWHFVAALDGWQGALTTIAANSDALANTLKLPALAASILTLSAFAIAIGFGKWRPATRLAVLVLGLWPILVAPVVTGMALVEFWNRAWTAWIYDTAWSMTVLGYCARFMPLALPLALWSYKALPQELSWATAGLGAKPARTFLTVELPLLARVCAGIWLLLFSLCAAELTVTILVQAPGGATLPLPIFSLLHAGLSGDVASLCLLQGAISGLALALATVCLRRR